MTFDSSPPASTASLPVPGEGPGTAADAPSGPRAGWQRELAEAFRDPAALCRELGLGEEVAREAARSAGDFPLLVPRAFVARMRHGDRLDPLLLQVLPLAAERTETPGWVADPLEETRALAAPALVKKYAGRALLLATGACAVHCRYCFRREFPYVDHGVTRAGIDAALGAIAADPSIEEVILSGGDPLLLDDERLADLLARLGAIPTVRRLRIHTRLPVVLPSRVTPELVALLGRLPVPPVIVIHANHPAEIDASVVAALRALAGGRSVLLNQAVLLAGVNDSSDVLARLSMRLLDAGVLPYYLHLPDRVAGTAHFDVSEEQALRFQARLRDTLPGYAVPRLVREVPGEASKIPVV